MSEFGSVESYDTEQGPPARVTVVSCDTCRNPMVVLQEDYGDGWDEAVRVWPATRRALSLAVPSDLRAEHDEARKCLDMKAHTAAVVMVRRTLEGVCAQHGVKERTLVRSLQVMRDQGHIDQRLLDWADALRVLGNEGAHYTGKSVAREDALAAVDFAEAMLDYLYVLTAKFEEFKKRRESAEADPKLSARATGAAPAVDTAPPLNRP